MTVSEVKRYSAPYAQVNEDEFGFYIRIDDYTEIESELTAVKAELAAEEKDHSELRDVVAAVRRRESLLKEKLADCENSEAALREELAAQKETVALFESEFSKQSESLTAAEQRNAELEALLETPAQTCLTLDYIDLMVPSLNPEPNQSVFPCEWALWHDRERIREALTILIKPTESGASE